MINSKRVLAMIPARGSSKRLRRKNILPFLGKPLIQWAWDQAKQSQYIDACFLSSEDDEILRYADRHGMNWVIRPKKLATDKASIADVLRDLLRIYPLYDLAVVLQPTSPLRTALDIDCGISLGMSISVGPTGSPNGAVYVVEVPHFKRHPYFGGRVFYMPAERSIDIDSEEDFQIALKYGRAQNRV